TTKSNSRLNFLSLLRGRYQDYVLGDAAFDYLKERRGKPPVVHGLRTFEPQHFCNQVPFMAGDLSGKRGTGRCDQYRCGIK
ncbi:hypothetical protein ACCT02_37680, partial [Rhizobium ruizarguesonis]